MEITILYGIRGDAANFFDSNKIMEEINVFDDLVKHRNKTSIEKDYCYQYSILKIILNLEFQLNYYSDRMSYSLISIVNSISFSN